MRLFQFAYSPYAAKVRKCLELKGLPFETVEVDYLDRRALVGVSGGVYVPVLEDGATVITGSDRITAYLDERHAPSLRQDPLAVVIEGWADEVLEEAAFRIAAPGIEDRIAALHGGREDVRAMFRLVKERRYGAGALEAWRGKQAAYLDDLAAVLAPIGRAVAERPFLLGEAPSVADAAVFGQLFMLEFAVPGVLRERFPGIAAWYARVGEARRAG